MIKQNILIYSIRRTDRATSTTGLLQRLNLQPLSECRGQRRLAVFSQYHHTNTTLPHGSGMYGPPNIPPVVDIQISTSFHSLTLTTSKDPFLSGQPVNGIPADIFGPLTSRPKSLWKPITTVRVQVVVQVHLFSRTRTSNLNQN